MFFLRMEELSYRQIGLKIKLDLLLSDAKIGYSLRLIMVLMLDASITL